jgi:hypothetical protein
VGKERLSLIGMARGGLLPTMRAADSHGATYQGRPGGERLSLSGYAALGLLLTPSAFDGKATAEWQPGSTRGREKKIHTLPQALGGPLNPPYVEWLMGWPIGWTGLEPVEMESFLAWLHAHSECSRGA